MVYMDSHFSDEKSLICISELVIPSDIRGYSAVNLWMTMISGQPVEMNQTGWQNLCWFAASIC